MNVRIFAVAVLAVVTVGCASQPALRVADAGTNPSVSAVGMSCKKPFALTQDCSGLSGPAKKINVAGQPMKVAGNETGTITAMFGPSTMSPSTDVSNTAYELLKRELVARDFEIINVTPIESVGVMYGYAIETTEPHYAVWGEFAAD